MKHAIVIISGSTVIGVYSNFKKFWETVDNRRDKQHYATITKTLQYLRPYDLGECIIEGKLIENVRLEKFIINGELRVVR